MTTPEEAVRFTVADPRIEPCPTTGCWLWMGATSLSGYGSAYYNKRMRRAHRVFWERVNGPIPDGLVIDHVCRVRCCVNPSHLRAVTLRVNALENTVGGIIAMGAAKTCCPKCSGPYTYDTCRPTTRICRPCSLARYKRRHLRLRTERALALTLGATK